MEVAVMVTVKRLALVALAMVGVFASAGGAEARGTTDRTAPEFCYDGRYEARVERGVARQLVGRAPHVVRTDGARCIATVPVWWYSVDLVYDSPPADSGAWRCKPRTVRRWAWRLLPEGQGPWPRWESWEIGVRRVRGRWAGVVCSGLGYGRY